MQKIRPDLNIGNNIRNLRKSHHMTQEDMTAQMQLLGFNMLRGTYAKIEANLMNIRVSELVALKKIFDCSYEDLFIGLVIEPADEPDIP